MNKLNVNDIEQNNADVNENDGRYYSKDRKSTQQ